MFRLRLPTLVVSVCAALTSFANPANSQLPPISVQIEVGLDSGTKALLETLPQKLQEKFNEAVNKGMDRIDFSVQTYIKELKAAAVSTTQEITCTVHGQLLNTGSDIISGLTTLLLGDSFRLGRGGDFITPPGIDAYSQKLLHKIIETRQNNIAADTQTSNIYATYSDLAFAAATLICQQKATNAPTEFAEDQLTLMRKALGEWRVWFLTGHCSTQNERVSSRIGEIKKIMEKEDPKLIDAASVHGEFEQLVATSADAPVPESGLQQIFGKYLRFLGIGQKGYDITKAETLL